MMHTLLPNKYEKAGLLSLNLVPRDFFFKKITPPTAPQAADQL
jgi:hypothetical protein